MELRFPDSCEAAILNQTARVEDRRCKAIRNYLIFVIRNRDFEGHATRNDIVDDIVDFSSSTMAFNVAKIASARASLTISLTKSLRVAGPLFKDIY